MTASKQSQDGTGKFHAGFFDDRFQAESGWNCRMYSRKLLMMGREDARNM